MTRTSAELRKLAAEVYAELEKRGIMGESAGCFIVDLQIVHREAMRRARETGNQAVAIETKGAEVQPKAP